MYIFVHHFCSKDMSGRTGEAALQLAASRGNWDEVQRLLEKGQVQYSVGPVTSYKWSYDPYKLGCK